MIGSLDKHRIQKSGTMMKRGFEVQRSFSESERLVFERNRPRIVEGVFRLTLLIVMLSIPAASRVDIWTTPVLGAILLCLLCTGILHLVYRVNRIIRRIPAWILTPEGIFGDWSFWGTDFAVIKFAEIERIKRPEGWFDPLEITLKSSEFFRFRLGPFGKLAYLFHRSGASSFKVYCKQDDMTSRGFLEACSRFHPEALAWGAPEPKDKAGMRRKGYFLIATGIIFVPSAAILLGSLIKELIPVCVVFGMLIGLLVHLQGCDYVVQGKGYSGFLRYIGFLCVIGSFIAFVLPNKSIAASQFDRTAQRP